MAGTLSAGTITDGTYSISTSAVARGIKAWILMDTVASPITVKSQMNITSVTDLGVGTYQLNFTAAMKNLNYGFMGSTLMDSNGVHSTLNVNMAGIYTSGPVNKNLNSCNVRLGGGAAYDSKEIFVAVVGD